MSAEHPASTLIERLPTVRGRLEANVGLAKYTWFKVGGPADALFRPADTEDLVTFLAQTPKDIPVMVMGNASNMLFRDGGVRGVVIRLGRAFNTIRADKDMITAGAGAAGLGIARAARDSGLAGLEFLAGIPGTIGGAVFMNAGAYQREVRDVFKACEIVERNGHRRSVMVDDVAFDYRHSSLSADQVVTEVILRAVPGNATEISARMREIRKSREESQPVRTPTGGSTFKNPPDQSAWQLIDAAGCRGLRRGGAMVSALHCNFLVNEDQASAADLESLGEEVRRRVMAHSGIALEWEIKRIGEPAGPQIREVTP